MTPNRTAMLRELLIGLLVSLVLNAVSIPAAFNLGRPPAWLLEHVDESYYFQIALNHARQLPKIGIYPESEGLAVADPLSGYVRYVSTVVGAIGIATGFDALRLSVVFDLVCTPFGFCFLSLFLQRLTRHHWAGRLGALAAMVSPWALAVWDAFPFGDTHGTTVGMMPVVASNVPPILRGPYTQLGFLTISAAFLGAHYSLDGVKRRLSAFLGGVLCSLAVCFYPFAGIFGAGTGTLWLAASAWTHGRKVAWSSMCWFIAGGIALSPVALAGTFGATAMIRDEGFPRFDFFRLVLTREVGAVIAFTIIAAFARNERVRSAALFAVASGLWLQACVNIEYFAGMPCQSFHFETFFGAPFMTAVFVAVWAAACGGALRGVVAWCTAAIVMIPGGLRQFPPAADLENVEMFAAVRSAVPQDGVVASMYMAKPFRSDATEMDISPMLQHLWPWTNRYSLYQDLWLGIGVTESEQLERELLTGWIFSGRVQPVRPCRRKLWDRPYAVWFTMPDYSHSGRRATQCDALENLLRDVTPCGLLGKYRVDAILQETSAVGPPPVDILPYVDRIWESSGGAFVLWRFDSAAYRQKVCDGDTRLARSE